MTGSAGLCGGIASANLNILSALADLARQRQLELSVFSYLEHGRERPDMLPSQVAFHGFEGDKWRFSQHLLRHGLHSALIAFDHVTLALPVLPYAALGLVQTSSLPTVPKPGSASVIAAAGPCALPPFAWPIPTTP
ncbi:MAG: hypothetical protein ETSY2_22925 [Candidatus Entotheonella gemina]|uniref:Uncharacterized protein n=1 Tax=Candidatus Entotheonella gemina TaxID=1429439 RepID=W4M733_9BACT|nr:MAG: hypothetical protein ETSY2_22925 [Candidatus Entotheonella gemina]